MYRKKTGDNNIKDEWCMNYLYLNNEASRPKHMFGNNNIKDLIFES